MTEVVTTITLGELAGGAVEEQFQVALGEVLANIHDPNTDAQGKRSITLKIEFKPTSDRGYIEYSVTANPALQPPIPVKSGLYSGKRGGRITVAEHVIAQGEIDFAGAVE